MTPTTETDTVPPTTAVVTIRIPCGAEGDLLADVQARLSRVESVDDVTVDRLEGIEPRLSATLVTVAVSVRPAGAATARAIRDRLTEAPGLVSVDAVGRERR